MWRKIRDSSTFNPLNIDLHYSIMTLSWLVDEHQKMKDKYLLAIKNKETQKAITLKYQCRDCKSALKNFERRINYRIKKQGDTMK